MQELIELIEKGETRLDLIENHKQIWLEKHQNGQIKRQNGQQKCLNWQHVAQNLLPKKVAF